MKQPNWKTPLILSATLFVVGTFAYWLQYSHKPKADKADALTKKPIALPSDDTQIAMIKIKGNRGLIELKCESLAEKKCNAGSLGKWIITNPPGPNGVFYAADASEVKDFLSASANAIATEVIDLSTEEPEKRKKLMTEYGLSDDQRANSTTQFLELILDGGKRLTAWFGVEHPIGDKTFVASAVDGTISDKTVYLLSNQARDSNFARTMNSFRDKSLFNFDRKNVTEFTAKVAAEKNNSGKIEAKKVNSLWTINGHPANFDRVETVLSAISNAKATDFVDTGLIKGMKPIITYDLKAGDKPYTLSIFEKNLAEKKLPGGHDHGHDHGDKLPAEKHYYAQSSERQELAEVEPQLRNNIDKNISDLRNTVMLTEAQKKATTQIKIEGNGYASNPEFQLLNGKWSAKDPTKNWEANIAAKIADIFAVTRVKEFVSPAPVGKELYKISIGDEKNPTPFYFSIYTVKNNLYARNLNEKTNEAYLLEESMKLALPKTETEWKIKATPPTK